VATDPAFSSVINLGSALLGSAETSLTVPTNASVLITAGASGSKVEEVVVEGATTTLTPATVAGLVYLFLYDGTTYHLFDALQVSAVTASTIVAPFRTSKTYTNLILKSGWSLRASQSIAGNANLLKVTALGGDY
jgi:hypothetical protein